MEKLETERKGEKAKRNEESKGTSKVFVAWIWIEGKYHLPLMGFLHSFPLICDPLDVLLE